MFDGMYMIPDMILQSKKKLGDIDWKLVFKIVVNFIKMMFLIINCWNLKPTCAKVIGNVALLIYQMKSQQQ